MKRADLAGMIVIGWVMVFASCASRPIQLPYERMSRGEVVKLVLGLDEPLSTAGTQSEALRPIRARFPVGMPKADLLRDLAAIRERHLYAVMLTGDPHDRDFGLMIFRFDRSDEETRRDAITFSFHFDAQNRLSSISSYTSRSL